MKIKKTWLTMIVALLCNITASSHDFKVDGIYYNITSSTSLTVETTYYGDHATQYDEYTQAITIPSTVVYNDNTYKVTSIGEGTFSGCENLTSVNLSVGVTSIGKETFSYCSSLTSIAIPEGVTDIGERAFQYCSSLISITLPESLTCIGWNAFSGCSSLTSIAIPKGVTSIGKGAFSACLSLTSIAVPEGVTDIGDNTFFYCSSLISITLPESLTCIGSYAFSSCLSLTSITVPEGVTDIGNYAFSDCSSLISITFPRSVTNIGSEILGGITDVKKVFWKSSTSPAVPGKAVYTADSYYAYNSKYKIYPLLNSMFKVDGITYVPTSMSERTCDIIDYDSNRTASSVNVSRTVIFNNVEFTVNNVNDYAFYGNPHIEEVALANQGSVGSYAFSKCSKLSSFVLPASTTSIGKALFQGCNNLTTISVAENNTKYDSRNNCNAIIEKETNKLIAACNETVIPESVTAIGDYAFSGCGEITSINVHSNIESIGDYAFSGCCSLAEVVIEDRNKTLTLGSNGRNALFSDCPLNSVYIGGKISYNTGSIYGYSPFSNNASLCSVTITDEEETVYPYEFYNCSALKEIVIGDATTSIGDYAFSGCASLESFAFGCSMKTIGAKAFLGCSNLKEVKSGAVNPPVCGANALDDLDKWNCVLYMPTGYKNVYQAADQWKEFLLMEDNIAIKQYALTYMVDGDVYHTELRAYDEVIVLPQDPTKEGYTFDGWDKTLTVMPAEDVVINALFTRLPTENFVIRDGEYNEFIIEENLQCDAITYTRTLSKTNTWNALYVPFEIPVTAEFLENYDVAYFNDIHSFDEFIGEPENKVQGKDGVIDRMEMEVLMVQEGATLNANYPYLIRAKNEDALNMNIRVENTTLYKTVETTVSCSSVFMKFDVTGIYTTQTAGELNGEFRVYAMSGGGWKMAPSDEQKLKPFRLYLRLTSIDGSPVKVAESAMNHIRIRVDGEEETTGMEEIQTSVGNSAIIYDLQGRRVKKAGKGIYIVNGKKVVMK